MSVVIKNLEMALHLATTLATGEVSETNFIRVAELTNWCIRYLEKSTETLNVVLQRTIEETREIRKDGADKEEYESSISLALIGYASLSMLQLQCLCTLHTLYAPGNAAAVIQRMVLSVHRDSLSSLEKALGLKSEEK